MSRTLMARFQALLWDCARAVSIRFADDLCLGLTRRPQWLPEKINSFGRGNFLDGGGIAFQSEAFELAVKRRTADLQPPRHFRHLPAVMTNGETDHVAFYILQRPDVAVRAD